MMAASFEDIEKANDIRINIGTRMVDAVTHSGLSCQIYNNIRLKRFEYAINSFFIRQITFDKGKPWKLMENIQPAFFQRNIIIIVKVIQTKDGGPHGQQALSQMEPNEPGSTSNQDFFRCVKIFILTHFSHYFLSKLFYFIFIIIIFYVFSTQICFQSISSKLKLFTR